MHLERPLVAVLSGGIAVFVLGSVVVLLTETLDGPAALVTTLLFVALLAGAVALGARGRRWIANPYW
ncbi:hypothetical protein [Natronorarus salvus]|uniref:hypothetical protein n=1 Tax=Natronorarus salvus TaxID=3117733 RepID=UPI002F264C73